MMRKTWTVIALLACSLPAALAQQTAMRWIIGETHGVYNIPKFDNLCMGLGVDRTFNEKLTVGLDITYDINHALKTMPEYVYYSDSGMYFTFYMKPSLLNINYHTEFALGDDDGTHVYIGTFIGLRRLAQKWERDPDDGEYDQNGNWVTMSPPKDVSKWLVPIGGRLGLRGATDGGFLDLYCAVGYQIGGGGSLVSGNKSNWSGGYGEISTLVTTIGLAYGVGW
jgi:hypothetical protein